VLLTGSCRIQMPPRQKKAKALPVFGAPTTADLSRKGILDLPYLRSYVLASHMLLHNTVTFADAVRDQSNAVMVTTAAKSRGKDLKEWSAFCRAFLALQALQQALPDPGILEEDATTAHEPPFLDTNAIVPVHASPTIVPHLSFSQSQHSVFSRTQQLLTHMWLCTLASLGSKRCVLTVIVFFCLYPRLCVALVAYLIKSVIAQIVTEIWSTITDTAYSMFGGAFASLKQSEEAMIAALSMPLSTNSTAADGSAHGASVLILVAYIMGQILA